MPFTNRILPVCAALLGIGLMLPSAAGAVAISLAPASQDVEPGDVARVDVVVSDLDGEIVSAYDLDVTYDAAILTPTEVLFGSSLGEVDFFEVFESSDVSTPGVVDLAQLSLLSDGELLALQDGSSVVVATLEFEAIAPGTAELDFVFDAFNDVKGRDAAVLELASSGGRVLVAGPPGGDDGGGATTPIPEPGAALLFALGACALAVGVRETQVA